MVPSELDGERQLLRTGLRPLRDTTVKAEAAHIAERFVLSDDAAEDGGELLRIALDTAFTARPIPYRQGLNGASAPRNC